MTVTVADVGRLLDVSPEGGDDVVLAGATHDSRAIRSGWLFCCVPGARFDGHRFASDAVAAGASALLTERRLDLGVPQLVVGDVRESMGPAAALIEGNPSHELSVVGVTGTNGKSSVVQLLADIWARTGQRTDIYGTLTGARTTPEAPDLQRQLRASLSRGTGAVAMEVSSHALELSRVAGTRFDVAVFTNLGRDHLDFHGSMEQYFQAKRRLFHPAYTQVAVVNLDDPYGVRIAGSVLDTEGIELHGFRLEDAHDLVIDGPRSRFTWRDRPIVLPLAGEHSVMNALAAAEAAEALGLDRDDIADALCATEPVRGRFELIDAEQPFSVAVDYAHTPDALEAVLRAAHQVAAGRVIVVFGCGGDRDREKRPMMGRVAQEESEVMIVTSDNPRGEDPLAIIDAILNGMKSGLDTQVVVEADRRRAINRALGMARAGDLVLVAGKGHETVQVVGDTEMVFDDRQVVLEELGALA